MNYPRVASRYSKALIDLAIEQNALDQFNSDASTLQQMIQVSSELALLLKNPVVKADKKQAVLKEIFAGKFNPTFEGMVMLLTKNGREAHLESICDKFQKDVLAHKGIVEAYVTSAVALTDADKQNLIGKLKSQLNKDVVLHETVDASVIGGLKLFVDGFQLDNTIAGKLQSLRNAMIDPSFKK
jgi:F-type H+-transporting ATPase subunit delta